MKIKKKSEKIYEPVHHNPDDISEHIHPNPYNIYVTSLHSSINARGWYDRYSMYLTFTDDQPTLLISGIGKTNASGIFTYELTRDVKNELDPQNMNYNHPLGVIPWNEAGFSGNAVIISEIVNLVATPNYNFPVILTCQVGPITEYKNVGGVVDLFDKDRTIYGVIHNYDITINVLSWNLDGEPAPSIPFSWFCLARGAGKKIPPL